jgi:hypothetical protein
MGDSVTGRGRGRGGDLRTERQGRHGERRQHARDRDNRAGRGLPLWPWHTRAARANCSPAAAAVNNMVPLPTCVGLQMGAKAETDLKAPGCFIAHTSAPCPPMECPVTPFRPAVVGSLHSWGQGQWSAPRCPSGLLTQTRQMAQADTDTESGKGMALGECGAQQRRGGPCSCTSDDGHLALDQLRQLVRHIVEHVVVGLVLLRRGVDVEARACGRAASALQGRFDDRRAAERTTDLCRNPMSRPPPRCCTSAGCAHDARVPGIA